MSFSHNTLTRHFLNIFPVPNFLRTCATGVHVDGNTLRIIDFKENKDGKWEIANYGEHKMPKGTVDNGQIKNTEVFTEALSTLKDEYGLRRIRMSFPEKRAYIFKTEVSRTEPSEMSEALDFKIESNVPVDPNSVIFDYEIIETGHGDDHIDAAVFAVSADIVRAYTDAIEAAGLESLGYRVEAQAVADAVVQTGDNRSLIIANIGETTTGLYLVDNGVVYFSSTVDIGAESIGKNKNTEGDKKSGGLAGKEILHPNDSRTLSDEIKKIETYWKSYGSEEGPADERIEEIVVCGRYISMDVLRGELFSDTDIPVRLANVWHNAFSLDTYIPDITHEDSFRYAAAIGLALEES